MKTFSKKSIISLIIIVTTIFGLVPFGALKSTAYAAEIDNRIEISELEGTSNISSIAVYGADIKSPTFTVTKGSPAYFNKSMGIWWKKNGDNWEKIPAGGRRRKIYSRNLEIFSSNSY